LLEPTGKVVALLRVFHPAEADWVLETDPGWGERASERLARFKLRTKADIVFATATLLCCRGEGWKLEGPLVADRPWPGVAGVDRLYLGPPRGQDATLTRTGGAAMTLPAPSDEAPAAPEVLEAQRIASGQPRMGAELTERTIPAETGLIDLTVSFTKGCYTGQELVARIDSRGNHVARRMVKLRFDGEIAPGAGLFAPEAAGTQPSGTVGTVTSVGFSEHLGWVGLGFLERKAGSPEALSGGGVGVRVID
jgi:folate-binding protein YgfZ